MHKEYVMKYPLPLFTLFIALALPALAPAATVDVLTYKDGYTIYDNYSSGGYIGTDWTSELVHSGYNRDPRAYVREAPLVYFDLSGLGSSISVADIQSVELRLNLTEAWSRYNWYPPGYIMFEDDANSRQTVAAGALGWRAYDFTGLVKNALQNGETNIWFSGYTSQEGGYSFTSLENVDAATGISLGPYLHLSTVPVPPAAWLMLTGIVAMAGIGRRRA